MRWPEWCGRGVVRSHLLLVGLAVVVVVSLFLWFVRELLGPHMVIVTIIIGAVAAIGSLLQFVASTTSSSTDVERRLVSRPQLRGALRRTRLRLGRRFILYLGHAAVVLVAAVLLVVAVAPTSSVKAVTHLEAPVIARVSHYLSISLVLYLSSFGALYWAKNRAKERKLLRIEKTVSELTRSDVLLGAMVPKAPLDLQIRQQRLSAVTRALGHLLSLTERNPALTRRLHPSKGPRTAWILIPHKTSDRFRTIHVHPWDEAYAAVARQHQPAVWNQRALDVIAAERSEARETFKKSALARFEGNLAQRIHRHASLSGFIFEKEGPRAYLRVEDCEAYDGTYLELIPADQQATHAFRSCAGVRLQIGERLIGVLMLFDTVRASFLEADAIPLKLYGHLLSHLVDCCQRLGCYDDQNVVYY